MGFAAPDPDWSRRSGRVHERPVSDGRGSVVPVGKEFSTEIIDIRTRYALFENIERALDQRLHHLFRACAIIALVGGDDAQPAIGFNMRPSRKCGRIDDEDARQLDGKFLGNFDIQLQSPAGYLCVDLPTIREAGTGLLKAPGTKVAHQVPINPCNRSRSVYAERKAVSHNAARHRS